MATLAAGQIYATARAGGFDPAAAIIATAIALAESGGDPSSHCLNCLGVREDSRGLWQINVDAHPDYAGANLYDPVTNAKAAFAVSSGGRNFNPWTTYTSGAYSAHLAAANTAAGNPGPVPTSPAGPVQATDVSKGFSLSDLNPITGFSSLLGGLTGSIGKDAVHIVVEGVLIFGGAALVVIGLYRTVQPTVQKVATVAGTAAKAGAA